MKRTNEILKVLSCGLVCLALILTFSSCATGSGDFYRPQQLGSIEKATWNNLARLRIVPTRMSYRKGDPIEFTIELKNTSESAYWAPENPVPTFVWQYNNGQRDGQLPFSDAPREYSENNVVYLEPGEKVTTTRTVKTNYFPREGVVEFQAILTVPDNTNPNLEPFLSERLRSNGFGLMVSDSTGKRREGDLSNLREFDSML